MSASKPSKGIPVSSKIPTSGRDSGTHSRSSSVSNLTSASDLHSDVGDSLPEATHDFKLNEKVYVNGSKPGCIKFLGKTQFAPGIWAGVLLDEPVGKNDGSVAGVKYFSCEPLRGIFARPQKLTRTPGPVPGSGDAPSLAGSPRGSTCSINISTPARGQLPSASLLSSGSRACSRLRIGERVMVSSTTGVKSGILRFLGETEFAKGEWAGIELDEPVGKNDGSVAGKKYFSCAMKYGLFSPLHKVSRAGGTTTLRPPTSSIRGTPIMRSASRDSLSSSVSNSSKASSRVRLGVTALTNSKTKTTRTGMGLMTTSRALEETLKEKEQHIEQLLKEHDLEKVELAKISVRCKEAETRCAELEKQQQELEIQRKSLEDQLNSDKRKLEDLQFQLEEEKVIKSDIELTSDQQKNTIKRIEEFIKDKASGRLINIREILEGKEILTESLETEESNSEAKVLRETVCTLEENLKTALMDKDKISKDFQDLQVCFSENQNQVEGLRTSLTTTIQEKDDVISNLRSELSAQLEKLTQLMADNGSLNEQISRNANESKLQSDAVVRELGEKNMLLSEELKVKNSNLEELQNTLKEKDSKISSLSQSLDIQTKQNVELSNQTETLQQTVAAKEADLIEKAGLLKSLETELAANKSQVEIEIPKQEEKILGLVRDIEKLTGTVHEKEDELAQKLAEISKLTGKVEELNASNVQLQSKLLGTEKIMSSENIKSLEKINSLEQQVQALIKEKDSFAEKMQKELEEKQSSLELLSQDMEAKKSALVEKESEISRLSSSLSEKDSKCLKTEEEAIELKKSLEVLSKEKKSLSESHEANVKVISELEKQVQDLQSSFQKKTEEAEEMKKSFASLQDTVRQKEEESAQLNSKLQLAQQNVEMLNKDSSEHVMALQNELSKLKDESTKTKTSLEQEMAKMQETIKEMSGVIDEKECSLREKIENISQIQEELKTKEKDLSDLFGQAEVLRKEVADLSKNEKELLMKHEADVSTLKEGFAAEMKKKEQELCEAQSENRNLSNLVHETSSVLDESRESSSELQNQLKAKEGEARTLSEEVGRLAAELSALRGSSEETRQSLEVQVQASKEELGLKLQERDQVIKETEAKLREAQDMLEGKGAELLQKESTLKNVLEEKEAQLAELSSLIESSREQLKRVEDENRNNLRLLESKGSFIDEFKAEKEKLINELQESLKVEKNRLEETLSNHKGVLSSKDEVIEKLTTETTNLKKDVEALHNELKAAKASNETAVQNNNEVHKGFTAKIAELEDKYSKLLEEKKMVEAEECRSKSEKKQLEETLLKEREEMAKKKEEELGALRAEVVRMQAEFSLHKQELEQKLEVSETEKAAALELKHELDLQHSVLEELQQELQNSEKKNQDLEAKLTELSNMATEKNELLKKLEEVEKLNKEKSERMLDLKEKLKGTKEQLKSNDNSLKEKEEECLALSKKVKSLESNIEAKEKLKSLEQENLLLKHKIEKLENPPETKLSSKDETNNSQMDSEERESLISQIDFLNSIIVDMKQKNENLQQEVELLKMGPPLDIDSNFNDVKKQLAPRLFCDICDMFDLHDTDECPKQSSYVEEEEIPHLLPTGARKLEERPYCNNCEIFGHWTLDCDEQETY